MHTPRLFIDQDLEVDTYLNLPEKPAHHVLHVLRKSIGDQLILFNGRGGEYQATVSSIKRSQVQVGILVHDATNRESSLQVTLGMGVLKREAMNSALQKATELGVSRIIPVETANTSVARKQLAKHQGHWQKIIQSACEQSGRTQIPELADVLTLEDYLADAQGDLKLLPIPLAGISLAEINGPAKSICLMIGPEGGFTNSEVREATEANFLPVSIGQRILRAETAPAALLSLLQYRWGDF